MQNHSWDNASFVKRASATLPGNTFGSVAFRLTGGGYGSSGVYFKRSGGFGTGLGLWPNDADAVLVTVTGSIDISSESWKDIDLQLLISHPSDAQPYLFVNYNNGAGGGSGNQVTYFSKDMGKSWQSYISI